MEEAGIIRSKKGNIQPAIAEIAPGHLIAYCRRGGGYGPVKDGFIVRAESRDAGRTWTESVDSKFPIPTPPSISSACKAARCCWCTTIR